MFRLAKTATVLGPRLMVLINRCSRLTHMDAERIRGYSTTLPRITYAWVTPYSPRPLKIRPLLDPTVHTVRPCRQHREGPGVHDNSTAPASQRPPGAPYTAAFVHHREVGFCCNWITIGAGCRVT